MKLYYDLHIHSCLSPCGDDDMTPNNIVNMCSMLGLDIIAVSDHNTALNLPAVISAAEQTNLLVIPAIEVCTNEEVHILCLFHTLNDALGFGMEIYNFLPSINNQEDIFGKQLIMDENDVVIANEPKLLINALTISIDKILKIVSIYDGTAIPAHVDKSSNSIISNLGFIPDEYNFSCIEVKNPENNVDFCGKKISNSDAHYLEHIAEPLNYIDIEEKSVKCVINYLNER